MHIDCPTTCYIGLYFVVKITVGLWCGVAKNSLYSTTMASQNVGDQLVLAVASKLLSPQELCRERKAAAAASVAQPAEPPLEPPSHPPSDVEEEPSKSCEFTDLGKHITQFKGHVKVALSSDHRKFEAKDWGLMSEQVPLAAAVAFDAEA